jgi:hypothetical protein
MTKQELFFQSLVSTSVTMFGKSSLPVGTGRIIFRGRAFKRSFFMVRAIAGVLTLVALGLFFSTMSEGAVLQKAQMVNGKIKEVDVSKNLLVIHQKVKKEFVDRELSILDSTEFIVKQGSETKKASGVKGLELLENAKGAMVKVKCDKDVNVLQVTVTLKK